MASVTMTCGCAVPTMPEPRTTGKRCRTFCKRHDVTDIFIVNTRTMPHPRQTAQVHHMISLGQDPGDQLAMMIVRGWKLDESAGESTQQADTARVT